MSKLKVAWEYHTHALEPDTPNNRKAAFEATPIMIDGRPMASERPSPRLGEHTQEILREIDES